MRESEERKQAEEQLRQVQKLEAIGTLTGGIAHDLNNILAAVMGFAERALGRVSEGTTEKACLEKVLEAGLRGRDLVRRMLTFSRKGEQEKKPLLISRVIEETVKLLRASIPSTIDIRMEIENGSGFVLADPVQMQQVIMNLCTNAAYAMRDGKGILQIELSDHTVAPSSGLDGMKPGSYVKLVLRDTGGGIPADVIGRIFDPFFTTKPPGEGTGLGLSVVHGIVKSHDGSINVESEQGAGTSFTLCFPKVEKEQGCVDETDGPIPAGHERILLVDDEEALMRMGESTLTELGYEVTSRMNGREALALVAEDPSRFDVVITDVTMPEMTGVELTKEVLSIRADLPIIMYTGYSHLVDANVAKAAGARGFVMKPLTEREIAKAIRKVLDEPAA
jgi:nitrogen-specific signal transduction histidine kinase/CheY-like chemotaxis protein